MILTILRLFSLIPSALRLRSDLALENLALRQQLAVLKRQLPRPKLRWSDRFFWLLLSRSWHSWKDALHIVKPNTVLRWQRRRFGSYWTRISRRNGPGRPGKDREIRQLIRRMADSNPLWGAPRVHGELLKLGIDISERSVSRRMPKSRECLDHVIILGEAHLRRTIRSFLTYYHGARTHLALGKDAPVARAVQPPEQGHVVAISEVGGLHHRYERRAA